MTARLTADGEEIEEGLVWRVFGRSPSGENGTALLFTQQHARDRCSSCTSAIMS